MCRRGSGGDPADFGRRVSECSLDEGKFAGVEDGATDLLEAVICGQGDQPSSLGRRRAA